jgi:hypothetical protein
MEIAILIILVIVILYFVLKQKTVTYDNNETTPEYKSYLSSAVWKKKRYDALLRDKWTCSHCGKKATEVHHKRYPKTLGDEPLEWLESICKSCHYKLHSIPKKIQQKKNTFNNIIEKKSTKNYIQMNWKDEQNFQNCPNTISSSPIEDYFKNLKIGNVFCISERFGQEQLIEEFELTDKKDKIWVLSYNKGQVKEYGLVEIEFKNNLYSHIAHGTFMTLIGAKKQMTLKQGKEWSGEDSIDDYI